MLYLSGNVSSTARTTKLLRTRDRTELALLVGGLAALLLLLAFARLADVVVEGHTKAFDERVLLALREPGDLSKPIGPRWLAGAAVDVTALGSATVLGLTVVAIAGQLVVTP